MFKIPANELNLNAPNNVVHGKAVLGANPALVNGAAQTGSFSVPDGVYVLWVSLVQSCSNVPALGKAVGFVPMLVVPGEPIPWFIDASNAATATATTFGVGSRQISSASGDAQNIAQQGLFTLGWGGSTGNANEGRSGNILVEW